MGAVGGYPGGGGGLLSLPPSTLILPPSLPIAATYLHHLATAIPRAPQQADDLTGAEVGMEVHD